MAIQTTKIDIKVIPSSSKDEVVGWLGNALKIKVMAPPERGRANQSVIGILAKRLGIPASDIVIESGFASQRKAVLVNGLDQEEIEFRLGAPRRAP